MDMMISITTTTRRNVTNHSDQERKKYIVTEHKAKLINKEQLSMEDIITTNAGEDVNKESKGRMVDKMELTKKPWMKHKIGRRCITVYRNKCHSVQGQRQRAPYEEQCKALISHHVHMQHQALLVTWYQPGQTARTRCTCSGQMSIARLTP